MTERAHRHKIETPQTYFIGLSSSTTEAERSPDEMRLGDVLSLSEKITINNITYDDKFRITFGDNPVRCSEAGQNKSGHYRLCSLPLHIKSFSTFKELMNAQHLNINEQRNMANRGGFLRDIESNHTINLQEINSREYCKKRKIPFLDAVDAEKKQKLDLSGRKCLPALLSKNPIDDLEEINLQDWEIMCTECLHDSKGHSKNSFTFIPGTLHQSDSAVFKSIYAIVHKTGDELYLLKDKHSAEDLAKKLVDITHDLESKFFPDGLNNPCIECGNLLTISTKAKCEKCSYIGYYRVMCEIVVHGYKNSSKRDAQEVLRFHNLTFLLYYFLHCIEKVNSRFDINNVIRSTYFVNTVYYMPIAYELHNLLSFNAGRNEDQFKQVKKVTKNFSNQQYTSPQLLLGALRRLEANKYYNQDLHQDRRSMYSKKLTHFFEESPPPSIVYTNEFLESDQNIPSLLQRLSTFLVSNSDQCYMNIKDDSLVFPYKVCDCNDQTCPACRAKKFPRFGINNIHTSSISKILTTKKNVFDERVKDKVFENGRFNFNSLALLISEDIGNQDSSPSATSDPISSSIISAANITTYNHAKLTLPQSYQRILDKLAGDEVKDYNLIKNSNMVRCLCKIYGKTDTDLIILDKCIGSLESYQIKYRGRDDLLQENEGYFETRKKYITKIRRHIINLASYKLKLQSEISTQSSKVDDLHDSSGLDVVSADPLVIQLVNLQKRMLALQFTRHTLFKESNLHDFVMTEYDSDLGSETDGN